MSQPGLLHHDLCRALVAERHRSPVVIRRRRRRWLRRLLWT